jgi:DNA-binding transcriptional ArsR family regulator
MPKNLSPNELKQHAEDASGLMKALAHPDRLAVLCRLTEGETSVGSLHQQVALSQSALSQHLAKLRHAGLVSARRDGQVMHYRIADERVAKVLDTLQDIYCRDGS